MFFGKSYSEEANALEIKPIMTEDGRTRKCSSQEINYSEMEALDLLKGKGMVQTFYCIISICMWPIELHVNVIK